MTLRTIHLVFILFAIVMADMLGAWAIYYHADAPSYLWLGIGALLAGLGLCGYAVVFVRKMDAVGVS